MIAENPNVAGHGDGRLRHLWNRIVIGVAGDGRGGISEQGLEFLVATDVAARGLDGEFRAWDVCENVHEHHILATTIAPAAISPIARIIQNAPRRRRLINQNRPRRPASTPSA